MLVLASRKRRSSKSWSSEEDRLRRETKRFRAYNRRRLLDFLIFYRDFHDLGYVSPAGTYGDDALAIKGGETLSGMPLSPMLMKIMEDPNARSSHEVLHAAVDELYCREWPLYMRLGPAYFFSETNPDLPDVWASGAASGSLADRLAHEDHGDAIKLLMEVVERELPRRERFECEDRNDPESSWRRTGEPLRKLKVIVPLWERRGRRVEKKLRRRNALEAYHEHRQDCSDAEAVRRAAKDTGYSQKEIRKIRSEEEGRTL